MFEVPRPYYLSEMSGKLLQVGRTVSNVVLDAMDIRMSRPIIDRIVDVVADVPWWEVATKIVI